MAHISMNTPLGALTIFEESGSIVVIEFGRAAVPGASPLVVEAKRQLDAYFDGQLNEFDLPLAPRGTPFQHAVWALLSAIPFGAIRTYGDLARRLGTSPRPVGGACGRNPIPTVIPCHRVVGSGSWPLGGYSGGEGIPTKLALLRLEGQLLV
jgi:methylated-DNA-[protein]-cysteine S-methyltransferase